MAAPAKHDEAEGTVRASRASVVRLMMPSDANFSGTVFGGVILAEVDRVAYIAAARHAAKACVTASIDRVDFLAPVRIGDVVDFAAELTYVGRTSMEVLVRIGARPALAGAAREVGNAYVTLVGVDEAGRPAPVPPLRLQTPEEKVRFEEARARAHARAESRPGGKGK